MSTTSAPTGSASPAVRPERAGRRPAAGPEVEEISADPLSGDRSSPINRVTFLVPLGKVRARRGADGVWECLDEAAASTDRLDEPSYATFVRAARAEARWLAGDDEDAARAELELGGVVGGLVPHRATRAWPCSGGG